MEGYEKCITCGIDPGVSSDKGINGWTYTVGCYRCGNSITTKDVKTSQEHWNTTNTSLVKQSNPTFLIYPQGFENE